MERIQNIVWPALEIRTKVALWRLTGKENHREEALHQAYVLGINDGCVDDLALIARPTQLLALADEGEVLDAWCDGVEMGRELHLSDVANRLPCECSNVPGDDCPRHFDHPSHARQAKQEAIDVASADLTARRKFAMARSFN